MTTFHSRLCIIATATLLLLGCFGDEANSKSPAGSPDAAAAGSNASGQPSAAGEDGDAVAAAAGPSKGVSGDVMDLEGLGAVFRNVFASLAAPGLFLFDLNTDEGFEKRWKGRCFNIIEKDFVCANRTSYDAEKGIGTAEFTIFRLDKGWVRTDVELLQKCHAEDDVVSELERAGFGEIRALDASEDMHFRDVGRTFFLAEKRAEDR